MRLSFLGGARTVTGSQFLLEACGKRLLIDVGMYQGPDHLRHQGRPDFHVNYADVDILLLTHAHIDHSGNLPLITRLGFRGPVYATAATCDLCRIMLVDSAHIQEEDWRHDFRRWARYGREGPPPAPLYQMEDVEAALKLLQPVAYEELVELAPGLRARWRDAGHILGAASIEIWAEESLALSSGRKPSPEIKLLFSGDIGHSNRPLLRDPSLYEEADFVIMESTYGNRRHEPVRLQRQTLEATIREAAQHRSHILVPAFAIGRTQELLYVLNEIIETKSAPRLPVFVDSPLAIRATEIAQRHPECFDAETQALLMQGDNPLDFPGLKLTRTVEESKAINALEGPLMIIAGSGMCTGGRIRHHLQNHLGHSHDIILFVGYQAAGTLGRYLLEGHPVIKLFGQKMAVKAHVRSLTAFSAHADVEGLLRWLEPIKGPQAVFIVHGEEQSSLDFAALAHQQLQAPTLVPEFGETFELSTNDAIQHKLTNMAEIWQRHVNITTAEAGYDEAEEGEKAS